MGARVNGALVLMTAIALGVGCAGRSERHVGDDDGAGASGAVGGAGGVAGASSGAGGGGSGGTLSTGSGAINAGGNSGAGVSGAGGSAGTGVADTSFGEGGAAAGPPLTAPIWFQSGSLALSRRAYQRTIAQLLGLPFDETLPRERMTLEPGTDPMVSADPRPELSDMARAAVEAMDEPALLDVLGCADSSRECAETIAEEFAPRAFRRALEMSEIDAVLAVFDAAAAEMDSSAVKATVISVLSSPNAQWIRAIGSWDEHGSRWLHDYELASLLSYGLTGLPPDEPLWEVMMSGRLGNSQRRREQAERLLRTRDGGLTYQDLIRDWFRIRDPKDLWFYATDPGLAEAMDVETRTFIDIATFNDEAPVSELLDARWSPLSAELVGHYGIMTSSASAIVDLSATRRRGLLHQGSFLASRSYAEQGGLIARSIATLGLLCEVMPEPPAEVPPVPNPSSGTYRERLSQSTATAGCQTCHRVLDPVAFSFGKFDGYGRYVELENGVPIDSAGSVSTFEGESFTFTDSAELAEQLAVNPKFVECFNRHVLVSVAGAPLMDAAATDYVARIVSDGSVPSMIETVLAWVESDYFVMRRPAVD